MGRFPLAGNAAGLNAVYHFTFTGKEEKQANIPIRNGKLQVRDGHQGTGDFQVSADSETWIGFLAKERSLLWALIGLRIHIKGLPKFLVAFGKCFPSAPSPSISWKTKNNRRRGGVNGFQ